MTYSTIILEKLGTVARITLNRPERANALNGAMLGEIGAALDDGEPELKFGAGIVVMILPWLVGPKIAKEIILLGEDRIPATRAKEIGIVNRIVPTGELEDRALAMARHIATIDASLVKRTKQAINRAVEAQGMLGALEEALALDLVIEGEGCRDKIAFMDIARREGLKSALAWRDARFRPLSPRG